jgi:outer membrane protein TolC
MMRRVWPGLIAVSLIAAPVVAHAQDQDAPAAMVRDVLPIDLATALKLAQARNLDIAAAQQRVRAGHGDVNASIGSALPAVGVGVGATDLGGATSAPGGGYQVGRFSRVSPMLFASWVLNPAQAIFDVLAARRRLDALRQDSDSTRLIVARDVALAYFDLAKAQAHVATTTRRVAQSDELARLAHARETVGMGLALDTHRAEAARDAAQVAAIAALNGYYAASVRLAQVLDLDPAVMLVPAKDALQAQNLLPPDSTLDALLARAFLQRPDLAALRKRLGAADAARASTLFGGLGPQIQANGVLANVPPANSASDTMFRQQFYGGSVGLTLSAALIGRMQGANAARALAGIEVARNLEAVRAGVVLAQQDRLASARSLPLAAAQVQSAQAAYDLARSGVQAGTAVLADVLQADADLLAAREAYDQAVANDCAAQVRLLYAVGETAGR